MISVHFLRIDNVLSLCFCTSSNIASAYAKMKLPAVHHRYVRPETFCFETGVNASSGETQ